MWLSRLALVVIAAASTLIAGGCTGSRTVAHTPPAASKSTVKQPNSVGCDSVKLDYGPKLQDRHLRCALWVKDLTVDVSSDPAWSFSVRDATGVVQRFDEPVTEIGETGALPVLQDIDRSGTPVLLVVIGRGGTGGEPMAVWRLSGQSPRFVRAGELFGFRRFYQSSEGYFGNYAHSSAVAGTVTLYRWVGDKLTSVVVLDMQAAAADVPSSHHDWLRNGDVLCALSDDNYPPGSRAERETALTAAGIDPATAQQQFCTQPWVASVYR